jgi:hypothetical protein
VTFRHHGLPSQLPTSAAAAGAIQPSRRSEVLGGPVRVLRAALHSREVDEVHREAQYGD